MQSIRCKTRSLRDGRGWNQLPQTLESGRQQYLAPWYGRLNTAPTVFVFAWRMESLRGVLSELPPLIIGIVYAKLGGGKTTWTCLYKFMQSIPVGNFITKRTSQSFAKLLGCIPFARQLNWAAKNLFLTNTSTRNQERWICHSSYVSMRLSSESQKLWTRSLPIRTQAWICFQRLTSRASCDVLLNEIGRPR